MNPFKCQTIHKNLFSFSWKTLVSAFFFLFLLASLGYYLAQPLLLRILSLVVPFLFIPYLFGFSSKKTFTIRFFLVFSIMILLSSVAQERPLLHALYYILVFTSNLFFALLLNEGKISTTSSKIYYLLILTILGFVVFSGVGYQFGDRGIKNTSSWLALSACASFYLVTYQNKRPRFYPVWPALISFIISLWAVGRSGIISTGLILCGVLLFNVFSRRNFLSTIIPTVLLIAIATFSVSILLPDTLSMVADRFAEEGIQSPGRVMLFRYYLEKIQTTTPFLFGYDIRNDLFMVVWNFNLHNSFLQLHHIAGIGGILILFSIFCGIFKKGRDCFLLWFIGFGLFLRVSTDTVALMGPLDFLFVYFLIPNTKKDSNNLTNTTFKKQRVSRILPPKMICTSSD